jgi:hypothetical protein
MTMVSSGPISLGGSATTAGLNQSVNIELGRAATASINMNESAVRTLAGVPSGAISMSNFYGKSNRVTISSTFTTTTLNASLNVNSISGYVAGASDITVTVNSGIYLYQTSGSYGLNLTGGTTGDTITLVNNGFIIGAGGGGGGGGGGTALNVGTGINITINNTNASAYIAGGGGGGTDGSAAGGGGGAGGGPGGGFGGAGGGPGASGANGSSGGCCNFEKGGGGGGRILPGTGGPGVGPFNVGRGGGAGGGGGAAVSCINGGAGGSANNAGSNGSSGTGGTGGGGGWGASGGTGQNSGPGAGGKAVNLNGKSVTWVSGNTTRVWGAVS